MISAKLPQRSANSEESTFRDHPKISQDIRCQMALVLLHLLQELLGEVHAFCLNALLGAAPIPTVLTADPLMWRPYVSPSPHDIMTS